MLNMMRDSAAAAAGTLCCSSQPVRVDVVITRMHGSALPCTHYMEYMANLTTL